MLALCKRILGLGTRGAPGRVLSSLPASGATPEQLARVEARMLAQPQLDAPVLHRFAPGVYLRSVVMPAGADVIGHEHRTEHFNLLLRGRCLVLSEGRVVELRAPAVFVSGAGVRKVLHILEETEWATVHATTETDVEKLESAMVTKSAVWRLHAEEAAALAAAKARLAPERENA